MTSASSFRTARSESSISDDAFQSIPPTRDPSLKKAVSPPHPPQEEAAIDLPAPSTSSSSSTFQFNLPSTILRTNRSSAMSHPCPPLPLSITSRANALPSTKQQQDKWLRELETGFFDAEPYLMRPFEEPQFADTWYAELGLEPLQHVVGIPEAYQTEWLEERTVNLWGVPKDVKQDEMHEYLKDFGKVDKLPLIIDICSQQTFRYAIMRNKEEATRVVKLFKLAKIRSTAGADGNWTAMPALPPHRGLVIGFHRQAGNFVRGGRDDEEPIFAYKQELGPGRDPTKPAGAEHSKLSANAQPFSSDRQTSTNPPPGMGNFRPAKGGQAIIQEQRFPLGIPPPALTSYQTAAQYTAGQYLGHGSTLGLSVYDTSTPEEFGLSAYTSIYETPSKVNKNVNPKGKVKASETADNAFYNQVETNNSVYTQYELGNSLAGEQYCVDPYAQYHYQYSVPLLPPQPTPVEPLLARLRKVTSKTKVGTEAVSSISMVTEHPTPVIPLPAVSARKASKSIVAVPTITPNKVPDKPADCNHQTPATQSGLAPKIILAETNPAVAEPLATISESVNPPEGEPAAVESVAPALSSWAAVAGSLPKGFNVINVAPGKPSNISRLKTLARIPIGPNPSQNEPLIDQMRVVFLLDMPTNMTLTTVSAAVQEGPIRSIHFGIDEEKKSRYCAIVFQHATDASVFTKVLLKERADRKPDRFKFIVDVVRGEEPFPLDDVLRAMLPPTNASRRLTLVKASFFFIVNKRAIHQRVEKIVGAGAIQIIWLYNGGNATIVFSDVGSAIAVKAIFDTLSSNREETAFIGLQTTFSKCPGVQPLVLTTALPPEANAPL